MATNTGKGLLRSIVTNQFVRKSDLLLWRELLIFGDYFTLIFHGKDRFAGDVVRLIELMEYELDIRPIWFHHSMGGSDLPDYPSNEVD